MAKKQKPLMPDWPNPEPRPGMERFSDWSLSSIVPLEPGEVLVNDDPDDPNRIATYRDKKPKK